MTHTDIDPDTLARIRAYAREVAAEAPPVSPELIACLEVAFWPAYLRVMAKQQQQSSDPVSP